MIFMPFALVVWLAIASAVVGLAVYRKLISRNEDDSLHMGPGDSARIAEQVALAHRLDSVDKWGKTLTVIAVALGVVLVAVAVYEAWASSLTINP